MADPRIVMEGIALGECPRWHENRLWFSDWGARQIVAMQRTESMTWGKCFTCRPIYRAFA
jgi:hypothetical protein